MNSPSTLDRRTFLAKALPAGACVGCVLSQALRAAETKPAPGAAAVPSSGMNSEQVYAFHYDAVIPVLQAMVNAMGREKGLALLTKAVADRDTAAITAAVKDMPKRDLAAFAKFFDDVLSAPPYAGAIRGKVTAKSDKLYETTYEHCLPAKLLKERGAADIGYAFECSAAAPMAKAFNPKIVFENPKNLMKGDDVCIVRFKLPA